MILEICLDNSFAVKGSAQIKTQAMRYIVFELTEFPEVFLQILLHYHSTTKIAFKMI
jgi:hypothetical protein